MTDHLPAEAATELSRQQAALAARLSAFLCADNSMALDDAFDHLVDDQITTLVHTYRDANGITWVVEHDLLALYQVWREHLLDQEAEAIRLAQQEGAIS